MLHALYVVVRDALALLGLVVVLFFVASGVAAWQYAKAEDGGKASRNNKSGPAPETLSRQN